ncbi:MAG: leucine-rich repeat protein [Clostridiales Family XIII bacterium]|nr:leucine-rich repeat protein [Clostridiales Family XIII bacterium]
MQQFTDSGIAGNNVYNCGVFYSFIGTDLKLPASSALTYIGSYAFGMYNGAAPDFSVTPNLDTIGWRAFYNFNQPGLDFTGLANLTTIGAGAFYKYNGGPLDFSPLVSLVTIDTDGRGDGAAFGAYNQPTPLDLSVLTNLKTIGSYAFLKYNGPFLDLTNLENLTSIGSSAFASYQGVGQVLDLSDSVNLQIISGGGSTVPTSQASGAFYNFKGDQLILGDLPSLTEIGGNTFRSFPHSVDLTGLAGLTTIGGYAFYSAPASPYLDLTENGRLQTIGMCAWNLPDDSIVFLPDSVTSLDGQAFAPGPVTSDLTYDYWIYTETDATTLSDNLGTYTNGYASTDARYRVYNVNNRINKYGVTITCVEQGTGKVLKTVTDHVSITSGTYPGGTADVSAPFVAGYKLVATETDPKSVVIDSYLDNHVTFTYVQETAGNPSGMQLYIDNQNVTAGPGGTGGTKSYQIGSNMILWTGVRLSGGATIQAGSKLYIPISDYIQNVAVVKNTYIASWTVEGGYIVIITNTITAQTDIQVSFQYKPYVTPWGHTETFPVYLYAPDGSFLMRGMVMKAGDEDVATLTGTMSGQPGMYKYYNGEYRDNYRDVAAGRVLEGEQAYMPGSEKDVVFTYSIHGEYGRNIDRYVVTDTIPTYTDADGALRYAQFLAGSNPGWTVIEWDTDGDPATTGDTVSTDPTGTYPDAVPTKLEYSRSYSEPVHALSASQLPTLKLRFPEAHVSQSVTNSASVTSYVNARETQSPQVDPESFTASDSVSLTLTGTSTRGMYVKSSAGPHNDGSGYMYFYDDPVEKAAVFSWGLTLNNTLEQPVTNLRYTDHGLDARMYYYGVANPLAGSYDAQVIAYDAGGNVLLDESFSDAQFVFPQDLGALTGAAPGDPAYGATPGAIASVEIRILGDYSLAAGKNNSVKVLTKLRDPSLSYESEAAKAGTEYDTVAEAVTFRNDSTCVFTYADENGTRDMTVKGGNVTHIKDPNNRLGIGKTATMVGSTFSNQPFTGGEELDYTLTLSGERTVGAYPEDFIAVDLLPKEVEFVSFTPSEMLENSIDYSYQVVGNYQGTGQTAVIIRADILRIGSVSGNFSDVELGTIRAKFGYVVYDQEYGRFTNEVYMACNEETAAEFTLTGTVADPFTEAPLHGGAAVAHGSVTNEALIAKTFELWKQVRVVDTDGSFSSIGTASKASEEGRPVTLEYKLNIFNNTEVTHTDLVLYDIFPYVGDKLWDQTLTVPPRDKSRGSAFQNVLSYLPDPGEGWELYITTDTAAVNTRVYATNDANWTLVTDLDSLNADPNALAAVRGIKLVATTAELEKQEGYEYTYQVHSPIDRDGTLIGTRAYNSFGESDSQNVTALESNVCYNEILPPSGSIIVKKVNETGEGLAGAELELVNLATGKRVGGIKISASDNSETFGEDESGIVMWTDVPIGNYAVREVAAPDGYQKTVAEVTVRLEDLIAMGDGYVYDVSETEPLVNTPLPPDPVRASVTVRKVDVNSAPLANAVFEIVGIDDGTDPDYPDNTDVYYRRYTNKSGLASFTELPLGHYRVTEVSPPGHLSNTWTGESFALTSDGQNLQIGPVDNAKAEFTLVKIGIYDAGYMARPNIELDATMGKRLEGVPFTLYKAAEYDAYLAAEAASPGSGTLPAAVAAGVTNAQGEIAFTGLDPDAHYTLVEDVSDPDVTGPDPLNPLFTGRGAGDDKNRYDVFIDAAGVISLDGQPINTKNLIIGNNGQSTVFRAALTKVDQSGNPVGGVTFRIATTNSVTGTGADFITGNGNGVLDAGETTDTLGYAEITEATLSSMANSAALLAAYNAGSPLYIIEKSVPSGYMIPAGQTAWTVYKDSGYQARTFKNWDTGLDIYKYTVLAATTEATLAYLGVSQSLTGDAREEAIAGKLAANPTLSVVTIGGERVLRKALSGATYRVAQTSPNPGTLTAANQYDPATGNGVWFEATTDATGHILAPDGFKFISTATYTVTEIKAPKGYKLDATPQTFVPDNYKSLSGFDGTIRFNLANEPELGQIRLTKLTEQGGKVMEGVTFSISGTVTKLISDPDDSMAEVPARESGDEIYGTAIEEISQRVTDRNGNVVFNELPYGTYYITEVATIDGYKLNSETYTCVVGPDSQTVFLIVYNAENEKYSSLRVTKTDDEGKKLAGVRFYLELQVEADRDGLPDTDDDDGWIAYTVQDNWGVASAAFPRQTDPNGVVTFGKLPGGTYRLIEATQNPMYRSPLWVDGEDRHPLSDFTFTVTPAFTQEFTVQVENPIVDTPMITNEVRDTDGNGVQSWTDHTAQQQSWIMPSPLNTIEWFDYINFGYRTNAWQEAVLTDNLSDLLKPVQPSDVEVTDEVGTVLTLGVDYTVSIDTVTSPGVPPAIGSSPGRDDPWQTAYNTVTVTFLPKQDTAAALDGGNEYAWLEGRKFTVTISTTIADEYVDSVNYPGTAFGEIYDEMSTWGDAHHAWHIKHTPQISYAAAGVVHPDDTGTATGWEVEAFPPDVPAVSDLVEGREKYYLKDNAAPFEWTDEVIFGSQSMSYSRATLEDILDGRLDVQGALTRADWGTAGSGPYVARADGTPLTYGVDYYLDITVDPVSSETAIKAVFLPHDGNAYTDTVTSTTYPARSDERNTNTGSPDYDPLGYGWLSDMGSLVLHATTTIKPMYADPDNAAYDGGAGLAGMISEGIPNYSVFLFKDAPSPAAEDDPWLPEDQWVDSNNPRWWALGNTVYAYPAEPPGITDNYEGNDPDIDYIIPDADSVFYKNIDVRFGNGAGYWQSAIVNEDIPAGLNITGLEYITVTDITGLTAGGIADGQGTQIDSAFYTLSEDEDDGTMHLSFNFSGRRGLEYLIGKTYRISIPLVMSEELQAGAAALLLPASQRTREQQEAADAYLAAQTAGFPNKPTLTTQEYPEDPLNPEETTPPPENYEPPSGEIYAYPSQQPSIADLVNKEKLHYMTTEGAVLNWEDLVVIGDGTGSWSVDTGSYPTLTDQIDSRLIIADADDPDLDGIAGIVIKRTPPGSIPGGSDDVTLTEGIDYTVTVDSHNFVTVVFLPKDAAGVEEGGPGYDADTASFDWLRSSVVVMTVQTTIPAKYYDEADPAYDEDTAAAFLDMRTGGIPNKPVFTWNVDDHGVNKPHSIEPEYVYAYPPERPAIYKDYEGRDAYYIPSEDAVFYTNIYVDFGNSMAGWSTVDGEGPRIEDVIDERLEVDDGYTGNWFIDFFIWLYSLFTGVAPGPTVSDVVAGNAEAVSIPEASGLYTIDVDPATNKFTVQFYADTNAEAGHEYDYLLNQRIRIGVPLKLSADLLADEDALAEAVVDGIENTASLIITPAHDPLDPPVPNDPIETEPVYAYPPDAPELGQDYSTYPPYSTDVTEVYDPEQEYYIPGTYDPDPDGDGTPDEPETGVTDGYPFYKNIRVHFGNTVREWAGVAVTDDLNDAFLVGESGILIYDITGAAPGTLARPGTLVSGYQLSLSTDGSNYLTVTFPPDSTAQPGHEYDYLLNKTYEISVPVQVRADVIADTAAYAALMRTGLPNNAVLNTYPPDDASTPADESLTPSGQYGAPEIIAYPPDTPAIDNFWNDKKTYFMDSADETLDKSIRVSFGNHVRQWERVEIVDDFDDRLTLDMDALTVLDADGAQVPDSRYMATVTTDGTNVVTVEFLPDGAAAAGHEFDYLFEQTYTLHIPAKISDPVLADADAMLDMSDSGIANGASLKITPADPVEPVTTITPDEPPLAYPPDAPGIFNDIYQHPSPSYTVDDYEERSVKHRLPSADDEFVHNDFIDFGKTPGGWDHADIINDMDDRLNIEAVDVYDENGNLLTDGTHYELEYDASTNTVTVKLVAKDSDGNPDTPDDFSYLKDKQYKVEITTTIKDEYLDADGNAPRSMIREGLPMTPVLGYGKSDSPQYKEGVEVRAYPPGGPLVTDDVEGNLSYIIPDMGNRFAWNDHFDMGSDVAFWYDVTLYSPIDERLVIDEAGITVTTDDGTVLTAGTDYSVTVGTDNVVVIKLYPRDPATGDPVPPDANGVYAFGTYDWLEGEVVHVHVPTNLKTDLSAEQLKDARDNGLPHKPWMTFEDLNNGNELVRIDGVQVAAYPHDSLIPEDAKGSPLDTGDVLQVLLFELLAAFSLMILLAALRARKRRVSPRRP